MRNKRDFPVWPARTRRRVRIAGAALVLAATPALVQGLAFGHTETATEASNGPGLTTWSRPEAKPDHESGKSDQDDDEHGSSKDSGRDSGAGGKGDKSNHDGSGSGSSSSSSSGSGSGRAGSGAGSGDSDRSSSSGQTGSSSGSTGRAQTTPARPPTSSPAGSASASQRSGAPSSECLKVVHDQAELLKALDQAGPNDRICYGDKPSGSAAASGTTNSTGLSASPGQSPIQICPSSASCQQSNRSSGSGSSSGGPPSSTTPSRTQRSGSNSMPAPNSSSSHTETSGGSTNPSGSDLATAREIIREIFGSPWLPGVAGGLSIPIPNLPATMERSLQRDSNGSSSGGSHWGGSRGERPDTSASSGDEPSDESDPSERGDNGSAAGSSGSGNSSSRPRGGSAAGSKGLAGSLGDAVNDTTNTVSGAASKILTGQPEETMLHTTGYSFQDNTPANSNTISCGVIHKVAGGTGTYEDPITVAVPGSGGQGAQIPCGTRIYYKNFKLYGIVEDTGATDYNDAKHTDIYVDGENISKAASDKCMDPVTTPDGSPTPAILNPPPDLPIRPPGPITTANGCDVGDKS